VRAGHRGRAVEAAPPVRLSACVIAKNEADRIGPCLASLAFCDEILTKPKNEAAARRQLASFRGGVHAVHSAVSLSHNGETLWSMVDTAEMHVRDFTDAFLDDYMRRAGRSVLDSVGAYLLEGHGIQLFDKIEGDYFTVLGMPLMPLLAELRTRNLILA
jgi:septum formation protein